jgi:replicative DNA helicase
MKKWELTMTETQIIEYPHSKAAEQVVLGCMISIIGGLLNASVADLEEKDFFVSAHKKIFRIMKKLTDDGRPLDVHLITEELKKWNELENVGGVAYLLFLVNNTMISHHFDEYLSDLKKLSLRREVLDFSIDIQKIAAKDAENPFLLLEHLKKKAQHLAKNFSPAASLYSHLLTSTSEKEICEEIRNTSPGVRVGMKIGDIDLKIPGGAVSIVALPTGHGKTLVLINLILNYLENHTDKKAYFFSFEESRAAILSLFLNTYINSDLSKNNRETIKSYLHDGQPTYVSEDRKEGFKSKKNEFFSSLIASGRLNIFYCDYYAEELVDAIRFLKENTDIGLIGIDYMQLLKSVSKKTTQRQEELKQICLMIKDCAVDTGLPVILAAQFNRSVVNEATINPVAIGEAGDIERVANLIIGGWNRNYEGFTDEGNKGKDGKKTGKESAIYLEILKGREIGIGHSAVIDLNGNTGKLTGRVLTKESQCVENKYNRGSGIKKNAKARNSS